MADSFDPLKNKTRKGAEGLNSISARRTSSDINEEMNTTGAQQYQTVSSRPFNLSNNATRSSRQQQNDPYYANDQQSSPTGPASQSPQVHAVESKTKPYWETREDSFEDHDQNQSGAYQYDQYDTEESAADYQGEYEYTDYERGYKKKGLSAKIDRLVQRFPALGKFYKQPPSTTATYPPSEDFQYDKMSGSIGSSPFKYELTADDLALKERYSDNTRTKSMKLQIKDQTQPVDIAINPATNRIYVCDVGRSIVEIFEMNGTFEHSIHDTIMSKFQPTAITVSLDGTIIAASHFNHCLHMHSPDAISMHSYKRFKLGVEGNQIHQFYHPAGITIDHSDGYLYVCDRGNNRIQVISPEGLCERMIELFLYGAKRYPLEPIRIALQQRAGQIVCITGVGDVLCFIPKDTNGAIYVTPLAITDSNGLGLENASGLAVDSHDRIFISDTGHHRIVVCTPDGSYLTSFGTEGEEPGQLKRPCGLDITADGTVIVTDPGNKRIQFFGLTTKEIQNEINPSNGDSKLDTTLSTKQGDDLETNL